MIILMQQTVNLLVSKNIDVSNINVIETKEFNKQPYYILTDEKEM